MALTELAVKQAKPKDKDYKLSDEKGMFLHIKMTGSKYWRLKYRHPQTRKARQLALGVYPETSLKKARQKREEVRLLLQNATTYGTFRPRQSVKQPGLVGFLENVWAARMYEPSRHLP